MGLRDYIETAIGEAAGKFAAEVQADLFTAAKGLVWKQLKLNGTDFYRCVEKLQAEATCLYSSGDSVWVTLGGEYVPVPQQMLFLYKHKLVMCRTLGDNTYLRYQVGLDITKLVRSTHTPKAPAIRTCTLKKNGEFEDDTKSVPKLNISVGLETQALEKDLVRWLQSEEVFKKAGLPHKRGWLLYGKPGTGKTTLVNYLANKYKMDIILPTWKGGWLRHWMPSSRKFFYLFEDFDLTFRGRQALNPEADFGNFLNTIDGINRLDNCVIVITTNDLSAIDPAVGRPKDEAQWNSLSTRPGRIDRCVYFDNPDLEARIGIARTMVDEQEAVKLAADGEGLSVAQFSAIVRERAMEILSHTVSEVEAEIGA